MAELLGGHALALDSDMVDVTQETLKETAMEDLEVPEEQESLSASIHIASSLGVNPHALQVSSSVTGLCDAFPLRGVGCWVSICYIHLCPQGYEGWRPDLVLINGISASGGVQQVGIEGYGWGWFWPSPVG